MPLRGRAGGREEERERGRERGGEERKKECEHAGYKTAMRASRLGTELDLPCSSVDSPGHGASLSGEVITQVEGVQVEEGGFGHTSYGALGYLCKHRITQLVEERGSQPSSTIWCGRRRRRKREGGEEESSRLINVKLVSYNDQGPPPVCLPSVFLTPRMWSNLPKCFFFCFYCKRSKTGGESGQG